jgi:hypothetical protein
VVSRISVLMWVSFALGPLRAAAERVDDRRASGALGKRVVVRSRS